MATKTSFKQQCPSCEAMVPIRDPSLVGRKIDCPKCKYRFVVEEPDDPVKDEAPAKPAKKAAAAGAANGKAKAGAKASAKADPDEKGEKKGEKGEKKSSTMIIGVALAVVALGLLGVGACFMFGVFDGDKKTAKSDKKGDDKKGDDKKPPTKTSEDDPKEDPAPAGPNITNMLPNDSQAVVYFNNSGKDGVPNLEPGSNVAEVLFRNGAFDRSAFQSRFGFPLSNIEQMAVAINHDRNWTFSVIRTKKPITKQMLANLNLAPKPKVDPFEYFAVNADFDPLGVALFKNLKSKPTTLHLYDSNTLVLADERQMEQFLLSKRQPPYKTQPPAPPKEEQKDPPQGGGMGGGGPPGGGMGGGPPGGGMGGGPPGGGMGGGGPPGGGMGGGPPGGGMGGGPPGGGMGGGPPGGGAGFMGGGGQTRPAVTASDSFLTVSPVLKRVFDNLDFKKRAITLAIDKRTTDMLAKQFLLAGLAAELPDLELTAEDFKDTPTILNGGGLSLREFSTARLTLGVAMEYERRDLAVGVEKEMRKYASLALTAVEKEFGIKVALVGGSGGGGAGFAGGGPPGGGFGGGPPGGGPPGGGFGGSSPPGGGGSGPPGGAGGGGPPGGGGSAPPGGGGSGPPGGGGGPPGGGFMGGSGPPGGGRPGGGGEPVDEKASKLELKVNEKMLVLTADIHFTDVPQIVERINAILAEGAVVLKNEASMIYHRSHLHRLAAGVKKYANDRKQFPRGTAARSPRKEAGALPYRPDERIAWTAELLTYLDKPAYEDLKIDQEKSWNEGDNQLAASLAIPYYLAADEPAGSYPAGSWRHLAPGTRSPVTASHFVGIAGIGLDAAEYQAGIPATAKKLGIFGYDRETKVDDIKDGLDQTIALIQVPPSYKTCWLSGGGGTIRGVAEEDSVAPFVCVTYKGKRGTFAIMADGKVRFIADSMKPETFKALCTIAGGDKIDNLNEVAPIVPDPNPTLETRPPGDQPKPPVEGPKPPVEGPKPPQVEGKLPEGWNRVDDKAGRYSVALRTNGRERKEQRTLPTPAGNVTLFARGMEYGNDGGALLVMYGDYPSGTLTGGAKAVFDARVKAMLAQFGKVLSDREITIQGRPGRELQLESEDGPVKIRLILAGNRLYQLIAAGKPGLVSDKDMQTFLDSFKITD